MKFLEVRVRQLVARFRGRMSVYDAVNEICRRLNCQVDWQVTSWDTMIVAVREGQFDVGMDGITITAALLLGLTRQAASRFSFLLSIPTIFLSGALVTWDLLGAEAPVPWAALALGAGLSFLTAYQTKYVPIGDRVEVNVGREPDITIARRLKDQRITNVVARQYKRRLDDTYVLYYDLIDYDETFYYEEEIVSGKPVDVKVELVDGSYHDVDSNEMAFKIAASMATKQLAQHGGAVLLEPIMAVEVVTPEENMGDVVGDLNRRRGLIGGMDENPSGKVVTAEVPLAEMFGYATDLRSATQGRATYTMEFSKYAEAPTNIAEEIISKGAVN